MPSMRQTSIADDVRQEMNAIVNHNITEPHADLETKKKNKKKYIYALELLYITRKKN